MIELAESYLGNITENASLSERLEKAGFKEHCLEVYLSQADSRKGRIHSRATSGVDVGIVKNRDWLLREGDIFETQNGKLLLIHLQEQKVMVLSFTELINDSSLKRLRDRDINLVHLGHVLGNHHWPIIIEDGKIYVELVIDTEVIEATIRNFSIPGLEIDYEWRSLKEHTHHHHHS
ncbi:urease accessory protein UreE [Komarekiella sp. 'clone 1']|uniref:Urease accessory protein UreE n=1 Tax=Komarekiella delphini-convector SJRDD-AB1 TaxID=2593771 RepID=A0AA40T260_9NOST|nr:urease accessory protein UreE [Komarekiella delphini-convector]MBD6619534.1 urease accessory protein UreE [Komarekiella delphini-convector SJRDD-AB1]